MKTISKILFIALLALVTTTTSAHETKLEVASSHGNEIETTLQLENWMLEDSFWETTQAEYQLELEKPLQLECWMLDESKWEKSEDNLFVTEKEQELELEPWMYNANFWEINNSL